MDPDTDLKARMAGRFAGSLLNLDRAANGVGRGGKRREYAVTEPLQLVSAACAYGVGEQLVMDAEEVLPCVIPSLPQVCSRVDEGP